MGRRILPTSTSVVIAALALLVSVSAPRIAWAKSYYMPDVRIDATVGTDGSLLVREVRTFEFDGDFTFVYWDLEPPADGAITDIAVAGRDGAFMPAATEGRPAGRFRVTANGTATRVEAYGAWSNETVPLTITYRVTNAAVRWADTAELYWQAVAGGWSVGTGHVQGAIHLPAGVTADQVKVWVHGPLTGVSRIEADGSVTFTIDDLPSETFVEPRVLFPAGALSQVAARSDAKLESILAEEAALANEANATRRQARLQIEAEASSARMWALILGVMGAVVPLALFVVVLRMFLRRGKEYRAAFVGEYFREPPADLNPAVVGCLLTMGTVEDEAISASLMDLADRGVLRMEPQVVSEPWLFGTRDKSTYLLTLDTSKWGSLPPLDQKLLSFLFTTVAGDDTLTIDEMQSWAKEHPKEFQDGMAEFKTAVAEEADAQGFIEPESRTAQGVAWMLTVLAAIAAGAPVVKSGLWGFILLDGPLIVAMGVFAAKMRRRSQAANELNAKYSALRNYLRDFSRLQEAPPTSVILWNKFLVLAVVFGIADLVIQQMKVVVPQVVQDAGFAPTYWWVSSGPGYSSPVSALSSGITSAASVASSAMSSASGGGGGFSGGGGGGFGGGGGGGAG